MMDELRFRSQHSPRNEPTMNSLVSPPRNGGSRLPQPGQSQDARTNLPRRFTTDSGRVPTLSSITSQQRTPLPAPPAENQDYQSMHKVHLLEKKKLEYERIREQRRRFEMEMQRLDQEQRREEMELAQMQNEMRHHGHQSEPTTPPEYHDSSGFPSMLSRPNRYSTSSLTSPPGFYNRSSRTGSQLASPQSAIMQARVPFEIGVPSRSVPTTRRNSDDDEKEEAVRQDPSSHRSSNAYNRYSMPVTRSRNGFYTGGADLDHTGTARFLFGEDDHSADARLAQGLTDDQFPTLVRREDSMLSASSAALDLALSPSPAPDASSSSFSNNPNNSWSSINRHRTRQSLSTINTSQLNSSEISSIGSRPAPIRHSLDLKYFSENPSEAGSIVSPPGNSIMTTPPKLQSSFSSNDVPTVKNSSGTNNHAQQHFHNHNASMGRIPAGAMPNRGHSRELSNDSNLGASREPVGQYQSIQSALQASAPAFGPAAAGPAAVAPGHQQNGVPATQGGSGIAAHTTQAPMHGHIGAHAGGTGAGAAGPSNMNPNANFTYFNGGNNGAAAVNNSSVPGTFGPAPHNTAAPANNLAVGYPFLNAGMQNMNLNAGGPPYAAQNFSGFGSIYAPAQQAPGRDSQARVIQHRRQLDNEAMQRFNNLPIEQVGGQIYELCKDQHGCRYLQRKLEERHPDTVHMIWLETNAHVVELMTDPFGNYLCQKLLEFCNDDERTVLIHNAASEMVRIALNQHGTRALQKMIEFVSTPTQISFIIKALDGRVVELIQDLNGNHVIQKCLNKLSSVDAQFIFDAVGNNCVDVGTHRHGCCVLQRCIDHANGDQKDWLIARITENAPVLVQDPFGNYVVQYIIDLNESRYTEPIVQTFQNRICQLSRHKFSSNVIEKCLRCSNEVSRDMMVGELLTPGEIERLLRDSFANYVVQTALEYATTDGKYRLVESIRPFLPSIRSTPYGRRIQAKIQAFDSRGAAAMAGQVTAADNAGGQVSHRPGRNHGMVNNNSVVSASGSAPNGFTAAPGGGNNRNNGLSFPTTGDLTVGTNNNGSNPASGQQQQQQQAPSQVPIQYQAPATMTSGNWSSNANAQHQTQTQPQIQPQYAGFTANSNNQNGAVAGPSTGGNGQNADAGQWF